MKTKLLFILAGLLIFLPNAGMAQGVIIKEGTESAFSLKFTGKDFLGSSNCKAVFDNFQPNNNHISRTDYDLGDTGIKSKFILYGDKNKYDFGFFNTTTNTPQFLISGYNVGSEKFIKCVEIEWSESNRSMGEIVVLGRTYSSGPFNFHSNDYTGYSDSADEVYVIKQSDSNNMLSEVTFTEPIAYIVIAAIEKKDDIKRVNSFTIHFVDEWVAPEEPAVKVQIGDGSDSANKEWSNTGTVLEPDFILCDDEDLDLENDVIFYITPDFAPSATKYALSEEKPEGMTPQAWRLYQLLESEDRHDDYLYDGFWPEGVDRINCSFDNDNGLTIPAPCSGKYILTAESANPDIVAIEANKLALNIWPGIHNTYEWLEQYEIREFDDNDNSNEKNPIYYFAINWVNFSEGHNTVLHYPLDPFIENSPLSPSMGLIHIPGLYDAEIWFKLDIPTTYLRTRLNQETDEEGYILYSDETSFNLADLTKSQDASMSLKIKKNGAQTLPLNGGPQTETTFSISLGDSKFNNALGVGELSEEIQQPTYFTIDGLPVGSDNLGHGLYIRKSGNKVEKIIL